MGKRRSIRGDGRIRGNSRRYVRVTVIKEGNKGLKGRYNRPIKDEKGKNDKREVKGGEDNKLIKLRISLLKRRVIY